MIERDLNDKIRAALAGFDPVRVENALIGPGTPDISWAHGWVESKVREMPLDIDRVVALEHYTKKQRAWHVRRANVGGLVHVALMDTREPHAWWLFKGRAAASHLGVDWTRRDMAQRAVAMGDRWDGRVFRRALLLEAHAHYRDLNLDLL